MLLVFFAPFLVWGAAACLIYTGWIQLNLKQGFTGLEAACVFVAGVIVIVAAGGLMGLLRAGWIGMTSVMLLAIAVCGSFVLVDGAIVLPFLVWPAALPAIVFLIIAVNKQAVAPGPSS